MRIALPVAALLMLSFGATQRPVWDPNRSAESFTNPIIHADYSDPDVIRVGADYFMVASSFTAVPGLPILHSRDLVNWDLVNHALPRLVPEEVFRVPRHGAGVWAPALRYHGGKYWIYYPDPDFGISVITADDPRKGWSRPTLVKEGKGLIDPCPLWDDDGRVYLVHAFARSRAGFANVLHLNQLTEDGTRAVGTGVRVVDGDRIPGYTTLEGPKFYKRNGWYYIFAPAGGVKQGWQSVFRSRRIDGPYEQRIVLAQGTTDVNGPHQGALVDTPSGEWWFIHFQDADAYGRIVHLQPVVWKENWPVIGADDDGDGTGEPRRSWPRPVLPPGPASVPPTSDAFRDRLGLQWQWQANPAPDWASVRDGLRLRAVPQADDNLWRAGHLLLQKFPGPAFTAEATLDARQLRAGERGGLVVFGNDYAWIGFERQPSDWRLVVKQRQKAADGGVDVELFGEVWPGPEVTVRVEVSQGAHFRFTVASTQGWREAGPMLQATPGRWVGAKVGLFAAAPARAEDPGGLRVGRFTVAPR